MGQSTFTETQIVSMLNEADACRLVNEIWRAPGISSAACGKWKATYGGRHRISNGYKNLNRRTAC